jgi:hypothetical protein
LLLKAHPRVLDTLEPFQGPFDRHRSCPSLTWKAARLPALTSPIGASSERATLTWRLSTTGVDPSRQFYRRPDNERSGSSLDLKLKGQSSRSAPPAPSDGGLQRRPRAGRRGRPPVGVSRVRCGEGLKRITPRCR